ncbi:hypothetical protein E2C01_101417 [Portunus trituberculatus]|uniref:Uncharacterized protein n=1 Tax=Portunus trituberculatus TaxID=210409 RepID=A0A5B7K9J8_PORTR|nr:hypothetical protein [Portunus trituberculatus]
MESLPVRSRSYSGNTNKRGHGNQPSQAANHGGQNQQQF